MDLLGFEAKDLEWYQMALRAVIVFIFALALIRIAGMRTFGTKSPFDVVLSITLGAILSRAICGHYPFFALLITAATLAVVHRIVAYFSSKSQLFNRLTEGDPVLLFNNSQKDTQKLSRHCITEVDLIQTLHEQNLDSFTNVKEVWLESNGKITIVKKDTKTV